MLFKKKVKRVFDIDKIEKEYEEREQHEQLELEKGDIPAMMIALFLAFLPAVLIVIGVVLGLSWLFFH